MQTPAKILLVDDMTGDAVLTTMALRLVEMNCEIDHVKDGYTAIERLNSVADPDPQYDIIIIDKNMPIITGFNTLKKIRQIGKFNDLIVVVLTSEDHRDGCACCYEHGADIFLEKHNNIDDFIEEMRGLARFLQALITTRRALPA